MQVSCSKCGARYRLPSGVVPGAGLRFRCKHCGSAVLVRGAEVVGAGAAAVAAGGASTTSDRVARPVLDAGARAALAADRQRNWHAVRGGARSGPLRFEELCQMLRDGRLAPRHFVWHPSLPEWRRAESVPALAAALPGRAAPSDAAAVGRDRTSVAAPLPPASSAPRRADGAGTPAGESVSAALSAALAVALAESEPAAAAPPEDGAGAPPEDGAVAPAPACAGDAPAPGGELPDDAQQEALFFRAGAPPALTVEVDLDDIQSLDEGPVIPPDDRSAMLTLSQIVRAPARSGRRMAFALGGAGLVAALVGLLVLRPWADPGTPAAGDAVSGRRLAVAPGGDAPAADAAAPATAAGAASGGATAAATGALGDAASAAGDTSAVAAVPVGEEEGGTIRTEETVELGVVDLSAEQPGGAGGPSRGERPREAAGRTPNGAGGSAGGSAVPAAAALLGEPDDEKPEIPVPLPQVAASAGAGAEVTDSELTRLLRRKLRQFGRCKQGEDQVKLTITLTVGEDGRVVAVAVEDADGSRGSAVVRGCVQRIVEAWEFPPQPAEQQFRRVIIL
jgi:DNA-directed RNA polymerase subunit RPC12/RpoP